MTISSVIIISSLVIMGINIGENTHHQLQVIVLVSFRIRNIRNNIVPKNIVLNTSGIADYIGNKYPKPVH